MGTVWEYKAFQAGADELETELNKLGADEWRLHTCEPLVCVDGSGTATLRFAVVMDRFRAPVQPPIHGIIERTAAMPMKG